MAKAIVSALALVLAPVWALTAFAQSVEDLESMMGDREKYFQPLDKEAPGFMLRNADGETVRLADFREKVVVLHFIYASCPDVCPLHAGRIAEVQEMVNQTPLQEQVQFVSITTDPVNDTAEILQDYGPVHGLDPVNWTFLTTAPDQAEDTTRRLAEAYGHTFTRTGEDGYQVHGIVTHVIDRRGRWRANFHGLRFEPGNLVLFLDALAKNAAAPHRHGERSLWDRMTDLF